MLKLSNRVHHLPAGSVRAAPDPAFRAPVVTPLLPVDSPTPRWRESLCLIERHMPFKIRSLRVGDSVQTAGDVFGCLHLVHLGSVKTKVVAACGLQQVVGLHLAGDWVGFDGIASGYCTSDGYAMDSCEIWTVDYAVLLRAAEGVPELAHLLHANMGSQLARQHKWRVAMATLPADARLADFLCSWIQALALRELRSDNMALYLTRAEIGNHLGMRLETVSRSFSRLVELGLIVFDDKRRRHFATPDVDAMVAFVASRSHSGASAARR